MCQTNYLYNVLERVQYMANNIVFVTISIINSNGNISASILDLNREQLFEFGKDSNGNKLPPYRSVYYAEMKFDRRGIEVVDLFLTGEFQSLFYLYFDGDYYGIDSEDEKTAALIEKYGEAIFGLTIENKEKAFFIIKPELQEISMRILKGEISI